MMLIFHCFTPSSLYFTYCLVPFGTLYFPTPHPYPIKWPQTCYKSKNRNLKKKCQNRPWVLQHLAVQPLLKHGVHLLLQHLQGLMPLASSSWSFGPPCTTPSSYNVSWPGTTPRRRHPGSARCWPGRWTSGDAAHRHVWAPWVVGQALVQVRALLGVDRGHARRTECGECLSVSTRRKSEVPLIKLICFLSAWALPCSM